jgi:hypothetical protein
MMHGCIGGESGASLGCERETLDGSGTRRYYGAAKKRS